jgi:large subunit ribosomal protein L30
MPRTFVWHPGKGPKTVRPLPPASLGQLRITQVRSAIGHSWRMRATLEAIGLRHHQQSVVKSDTPSLRGQLKQVRHLVEVTAVDAAPPGAASAEG